MNHHPDNGRKDISETFDIKYILTRLTVREDFTANLCVLSFFLRAKPPRIIYCIMMII
jgi:hypothetical protein